MSFSSVKLFNVYAARPAQLFVGTGLDDGLSVKFRRK